MVYRITSQIEIADAGSAGRTGARKGSRVRVAEENERGGVLFFSCLPRHRGRTVGRKRAPNYWKRRGALYCSFHVGYMSVVANVNMTRVTLERGMIPLCRPSAVHL